MGRHRTDVGYLTGGGPAWSRRYRCEWGEVVGARVRRLRQAKGLTLRALAANLPRPDGGTYSASFLSRLERGYASPPLWVYVLLAEQLEVQPGRLLGLEGFEREVDEAELALVRALRRLEIAPDEAIARVLGALHADPQLAPLDSGRVRPAAVEGE